MVLDSHYITIQLRALPLLDDFIHLSEFQFRIYILHSIKSKIKQLEFPK